MGFVLTEGWRIWIAPLMLALPSSLLLAILSLPGPRVGQVAAVVTITAGGASGFLKLLHIDPNLKLVDQQWAGHVIFVISQKADFSELAQSAGAILVFDAKSIGCSFSEQTSISKNDDPPATGGRFGT